MVLTNKIPSEKLSGAKNTGKTPDPIPHFQCQRIGFTKLTNLITIKQGGSQLNYSQIATSIYLTYKLETASYTILKVYTHKWFFMFIAKANIYHKEG